MAKGPGPGPMPMGLGPGTVRYEPGTVSTPGGGGREGGEGDTQKHKFGIKMMLEPKQKAIWAQLDTHKS